MGLVDTDGRASEDDALDLAGHEGLGGGVTREEGLTCTCWACADDYGDGGREEVEIPALSKRPWSYHYIL